MQTGQRVLVMPRHTITEVDAIAHEASPRCVCRPTWKALWSHEVQSVVWHFVHNRVAA